MEALTPVHLALILLGFMLLFGYKKLPDATRALGRSLRIFRSELRGLSDDDTPGVGSPGVATSGAATSGTAAPGVGAHGIATPGAATRTAAELEAEAAGAEALAAQLRARLGTPASAHTDAQAQPGMS